MKLIMKPLFVIAALTALVIPAANAQESRNTLRSLFTRKAPSPESAAKELEASLRESFTQEERALDGNDSTLTAAVARQRFLTRLNRLPGDNAPLDPTQQAIANVYRSNPVRAVLINRSIEWLTCDRTRQLGGKRKDQFLPALQIFRALGEPGDFHAWQISAHQAIEGFADEGIEKQIEVAEEAARAVWAVGQRAGDRWANMAKEIDRFTFVWAFQQHKSFRPENWPVRMRSAVGTGEPGYVRVYGFRHMPLPLNLTRELDDHNSENLALLIEFALRHEENSSGTLLPVQLAAVDLAGRSRSMYFAPVIQDVFAKTSDPELRRAAEIAIQACTRPVAKVARSAETEAQLALDVERIDQIFRSWEAEPDQLPHVAELRTLIGLDYGDDRTAWLNWWNRDQQSRTMCPDGDRTFLYRGHVKDDSGRPVDGATVSVSVAGEFTYHKYGGPITGWVDTDRDGRFIIRCGFSKADRDRRGIYSAVMNVNKPGYHFLAATGPQKRYFTRFDLQDETLIQIAPDEIVHPRSAVDMDIVLRPAAEVEVSVVDADGQPFEPLNIQSRWIELHPEESSPVGYCGCCGEFYAGEVFTPESAERNQPRSVYLARHAPGASPQDVQSCGIAYTELGEQRSVSFYFSQFRPGVSRRFAIFTEAKTTEPDAVSNPIVLPTAGRYQINLTWNPAATPDQRLQAVVLPRP